jgi:hypothetical protein
MVAVLAQTLLLLGATADQAAVGQAVQVPAMLAALDRKAAQVVTALLMGRIPLVAVVAATLP